MTTPALAGILIALVLAGSAAGIGPDPGTSRDTSAAAGLAGQTVGCELVGSGYVFGYGQADVPSSEDGACTDFSPRFSGPVLYTVVKNPARNGFTSLWSAEGSWAERFVNCGQPATLLVDWTAEPPSVTYVQGADCFVYASGPISENVWASYGGGADGVKFVHTDSLADAFVHLLT